MVVSCERRLFSNFRWPKIIRPIRGEGCTQPGQILSAPVLLSAPHPIYLAKTRKIQRSAVNKFISLSVLTNVKIFLKILSNTDTGRKYPSLSSSRQDHTHPVSCACREAAAIQTARKGFFIQRPTIPFVPEQYPVTTSGAELTQHNFSRCFRLEWEKVVAAEMRTKMRLTPTIPRTRVPTRRGAAQTCPAFSSLWLSSPPGSGSASTRLLLATRLS